MKQIKSFKEYLESKELLKLATADKPKIKIREIYEIEKYCSVPFKESSGDVSYMKFKPKELIEIVWEEIDGSKLPKSFSLLTEDEHKNFTWSSAKIKSWIEKTTKHI